MIIGLTGPARSGKDTVADYLVNRYGFKHFDFYRDVFLEELKARGFEPTKRNASELGDKLRQERGMGVMAELLFPKMGTGNIVITGIRSPAEVEFFRTKGKDFYLILMQAPPEKRYDRRDSTEQGTFREFLTRDERDFKNKGMEQVFRMADQTIENGGTIGELHEKVEGVMAHILGGGK